MDPSQLEKIAAAENVGNAPGEKRCPGYACRRPGRSKLPLTKSDENPRQRISEKSIEISESDLMGILDFLLIFQSSNFEDFWGHCQKMGA